MKKASGKRTRLSPHRFPRQTVAEEIFVGTKCTTDIEVEITLL